MKRQHHYYLICHKETKTLLLFEYSNKIITFVNMTNIMNSMHDCNNY